MPLSHVIQERPLSLLLIYQVQKVQRVADASNGTDKTYFEGFANREIALSCSDYQPGNARYHGNNVPGSNPPSHSRSSQGLSRRKREARRAKSRSFASLVIVLLWNWERGGAIHWGGDRRGTAPNALLDQ